MNYKVHNLWPIPVYQTKTDSIDPISFEYLMNLEVSNFDETSYTHLESPKRTLLNASQLKGLKSQIQKHIDYFVHEVIGATRDQRWEITTSWLNKAPPGGKHDLHWHSNSMISGVWYPKVPANSGAICFHKERGHTNLWRDTFCIDSGKDTEYNSDMGISPENNTLLLFPSLLNHSVLENLSKENRYSLAFNVFPRGIIGPGGNSELAL